MRTTKAWGRGHRSTARGAQCRERAKPTPGPSGSDPLGLGLRRRAAPELELRVQGPANPGVPGGRGSRGNLCGPSRRSAGEEGRRMRTSPPRGAQGGAPCSPSHSSGCGGGQRRGMGAKMASGGLGAGGQRPAAGSRGCGGAGSCCPAGGRGAGRGAGGRPGPPSAVLHRNGGSVRCYQMALGAAELGMT